MHETFHREFHLLNNCVCMCAFFGAWKVCVQRILDLDPTHREKGSPLECCCCCFLSFFFAQRIRLLCGCDE